MLSDDDIRREFLAAGFTVKDGQTDLKPYVFDAARRILVAAIPPGHVVVQGWQSMRSAPKDGTAVLVLLDGSDIPQPVRWLTGPDDPHATDETAAPGWHRTWDGSPVSAWDSPRYWMPIPADHTEAAQKEQK